ncbi:MAG: Rieske 2Fe-2S domain-containing protein [Gammaproteobacteria bacterium]|nr:Rieske 2Fe-2S domain-containing protein [Gammaproteobacteria bacterium]
MSSGNAAPARDEDGPCTRGARASRSPVGAFPEGWYFVATLATLRKRRLIEKVWLGQDIVAWCDDEGAVCVAEAYCAHLGSHLGPSVGGSVRRGCLVCPFHGFEYDITGQCVATPGAAAPTNARLRVFETQEVAGMLFAWWSPVVRPARWRLPELGQEGWGSVGFRPFRLRSHPEYTAENAVDVNHLSHLHHYHETRQVGRVEVDGAHLRSAFEFKRSRRIAGLWKVETSVSAVVNLYGLGYSFVNIHERSIDVHARFWVLGTPVDDTWMEILLACQLRRLSRPKRAIVGLRFLPVGLRTHLFTEFLLNGQAADVRQDLPIWSNRRYTPRPILNRLDGEIMVFRRYCRQFYPGEPATPAEDRPARAVGT